MEKEVCDDLNLLITCNIYNGSDQWNEFKAKFDDPDYLDAIFNIILSSQYDEKIRILGISALLNFKISPPPAKVEELFPLLYDDKYQRLIAPYIVSFCEPQFLCQSIFPSLCKEIQEKEEKTPYNGLILCFYEYVRIHKMRNETISQIILQLLTERSDLDIEYRKKALETFILQMNLINSFTEEDLLNQEVSNIMILFTGLPLDSNNFPLFEYLLYFIKETISIQNYDLSSYEDKIFQQIERIFDFLIENSPLDPSNSNFSTTLYYLIEIIEAKQLEIPFEKVFQLMIFGPKQFDSLQNNIEYFFGVYITYSDDFNDFQEDDEDDEDNEDDDESIEENVFKIFKFDFANYSYTLLDAQYRLIANCARQKDEYLNESIQNCLSVMNDSLHVNFSILYFFIKVSASIPIVFDPNEFDCYDNPILLYSLIDFCQFRALQSSSNSNYISFLKEFNYPEYIGALIESDQSVLVLCAYNIIASAPRDFINENIYETVLKRALLVILDLAPKMRIDFVENIFSCYLAPGEYLNRKNEDQEKLIKNKDPLSRRMICDSIFNLSNQTITAFKEDSQSFFGEVMHHILTQLKADPPTLDQLSELLQYFTGRNINQYINRYRKGEEEVIVNMGNYDIFFQDIIDLTPSIIIDFLSDENIISSGFTLFAYAFSNIYLPDNQEYTKFIDAVYSIFSSDSNSKTRNEMSPIIFDMILRIFIKNEKYLNLDSYCISYCNNIYLITLLIYEFSFILINKFQVYSQNRILSIAKFLLKIFFEEALSEQPNYSLVLCIGTIFARLSLSYSKEDFEAVLNSFLLNHNHSTTELFLLYLYEIIKNRVHESGELILKLFIAMYHNYSDYNKHRAQYLLSQLVKKINKAFDVSGDFEISSFLGLTYGLVKETIFYDDQEFLSHPLIVSSVCELIQLIVDQPLDEKIGQLFIKFGEDYPNI